MNLRHGAYETPALPLSYTADLKKSAQLQHVILPRTPPVMPENMPKLGRSEAARLSASLTMS